MSGYICPTITTQGELVRMKSEYEIYALTPRECWRMMDFNECAFEKASKVTTKKTQLYKQAGNSIVVNVLVAILGQMFEGKEDFYARRETKKD